MAESGVLVVNWGSYIRVFFNASFVNLTFVAISNLVKIHVEYYF